MAEESRVTEKPVDKAAVEDGNQENEKPGLLEKGRAFISRNKGKVALVAAGLVTAGIAWKFGYVEDAWDAAKAAVNKAESPGQSHTSIHATGSVASPAASNPRPRAFTAPQSPVAVNWHIRNLHDGWTNSLENRELAESHGVSILPNQSFIPTYEKYRDAA